MPDLDRITATSEQALYPTFKVGFNQHGSKQQQQPPDVDRVSW
jgi:hypothetical protein